MKATAIAALWAPTLSVAATAHADPPKISIDFFFHPPSGKVHCGMHQGVNNTRVVCTVDDHTWVVPIQESTCDSTLLTSREASFVCDGGDQAPSTQQTQTLDYGQTHTVGDFTCESEPSGITSARSATGHWFRIAQDSYEQH